MPAIQPARLRQQASLLAGHFDQPVAYIRSLHHLLDFYADRSRRQGLSAQPPALLETYNVRPPVLRQVIHELEPLAIEYPAEILLLCDALWVEPVLEFRQLAIALLGKVNPVPAERVIQRLREWIQSKPEIRLVEAILDEGCQKVRQQKPDEYQDLVTGWLQDRQVYLQQVGLQSLLYLVRNPEYQNLPVVFNLLHPFIVSAPSALRPDVLELIRALANRSPQETAYFLRQNLTQHDPSDVPFLIRQSIGNFPEELRESLLFQVRTLPSKS